MHTRFFEALSFAADMHRNQRRKDRQATPYINHPIAVATTLSVDGFIEDENLLIAAILHDTVEDTAATRADIEMQFGRDVSALVEDVTDDKNLPKAERKRLQITHANTLGPKAKQLKIADKICNVRDIGASPPEGWSIERLNEYLDWAISVVDGCRGVNPLLDKAFDRSVTEARETILGNASP